METDSNSTPDTITNKQYDQRVIIKVTFIICNIYIIFSTNQYNYHNKLYNKQRNTYNNIEQCVNISL